VRVGKTGSGMVGGRWKLRIRRVVRAVTLCPEVSQSCLECKRVRANFRVVAASSRLFFLDSRGRRYEDFFARVIGRSDFLVRRSIRRTWSPSYMTMNLAKHYFRRSENDT
jgi:hypothetical protein